MYINRWDGEESTENQLCHNKGVHVSFLSKCVKGKHGFKYKKGEFVMWYKEHG